MKFLLFVNLLFQFQAASQIKPLTDNYKTDINTTSHNWIRTARVFLIDAYQPPFAPKLEFDAESLAETMEDMNVNTVRMGTMGKYATIQGVRFSTHPDQGDRDLLAEMIAACKPRGIRVVPYISTGHKLAWSMVTQDYPEYRRCKWPDGEPDRNHMYVGEDHGTVCWMSPYRQAYFDYVEHVVRDYDIDGLYFDAWTPFYFWKGLKVCYCTGCRDGFREATGLEIPYHENEEDYIEEEKAIIAKYQTWFREEYMKIVPEVRRLVKSYKDIPLISNINNPRNIATADSRIVEAMDAFLYERGKTMLERAEGVSLARAQGLGVWPYVGVYNNWPRVCYNGANYQQQIFTNASFGGGAIIAQPTGYVYHHENREFVRYPFGILETHENDLLGFENYAYVAVVYGYKNPPGHVRSAWWWKADSRSASLGAFAGCLYRHVQVCSIHEHLLDEPEKLSAYSVLYLADITHLSEEQVVNIKQFVQNGGGLVVSYATSLYNSEGERMDRFALEDLIRVKPLVPEEELAEIIANYQCMLGGPNDLYLLARSGAADFKQDWSDRMVPLWFYEPVEVLEGGAVLMDIVKGDGKKPILPGVVVSKYGEGQIVYLSSAIESLFLEDNPSVLGDLIKALVEVVAPEPAPYSMDAPSSLISNLTVNGNRRVLHMVNWTGNKFERNRLSAYYLAPVENVSVRIRIPEGREIQKVSTFVNVSYKKKENERFLELFFPSIEAYQAVSVEFK